MISLRFPSIPLASGSPQSSDETLQEEAARVRAEREGLEQLARWGAIAAFSAAVVVAVRAVRRVERVSKPQ